MNVLYAFLMCFSVAYGLTCYSCHSTLDWDDCEKTKVNDACPDGFDRCVKASYSGKADSSKGFIKQCSSPVACNKTDLCNSLGSSIDKCNVYCCEGDLCNGAKVPLVSTNHGKSPGNEVVVSTFLILTCALVAFFR
ncbi:hypothetical protein ABFA07_002493 [Porites harrisoni]